MYRVHVRWACTAIYRSIQSLNLRTCSISHRNFCMWMTLAGPKPTQVSRYLIYRSGKYENRNVAIYITDKGENISTGRRSVL